MTHEGMRWMLESYFKGVNFTSPPFDIGLGYNWAETSSQDSTAAKMTTSFPNPPTTNNFQDDPGTRLNLDFSAAAALDSGQLVKFAPPTVNLTMLVLNASLGYTNISYVIATDESFILAVIEYITTAPDPAVVAGDLLETVVRIKLNV